MILPPGSAERPLAAGVWFEFPAAQASRAFPEAVSPDASFRFYEPRRRANPKNRRSPRPRLFALRAQGLRPGVASRETGWTCPAEFAELSVHYFHVLLPRLGRGLFPGAGALAGYGDQGGVHDLAGTARNPPHQPAFPADRHPPKSSSKAPRRPKIQVASQPRHPVLLILRSTGPRKNARFPEASNRLGT